MGNYVSCDSCELCMSHEDYHLKAFGPKPRPGFRDEEGDYMTTEPGVKADDGKTLAATLLDFAYALDGVADVATFGANKYTREGWATVPDGEARYMDALFRHLLASRHEELDPESGRSHLAHAAWNKAPNWNLFFMSVGCGIDPEHPAFAYAGGARTKLS